MADPDPAIRECATGALGSFPPTDDIVEKSEYVFSALARAREDAATVARRKLAEKPFQGNIVLLQQWVDEREPPCHEQRSFELTKGLKP